MKLNFSFILLAILIVLTSCSTEGKAEIKPDNKEDFINVYNSETDAQVGFIRQGSPQSMVAVKDGYYFISNYYLYYMDKSYLEPVVLDSNPNSDCLVTPLCQNSCRAPL